MDEVKQVPEREKVLDRLLLQEILAGRIAYHLELDGVSITQEQAMNAAAQIAVGWDSIMRRCMK